MPEILRQVCLCCHISCWTPYPFLYLLKQWVCTAIIMCSLLLTEIRGLSSLLLHSNSSPDRWEPQIVRKLYRDYHTQRFFVIKVMCKHCDYLIKAQWLTLTEEQTWPFGTVKLMFWWRPACLLQQHPSPQTHNFSIFLPSLTHCKGQQPDNKRYKE